MRAFVIPYLAKSGQLGVGPYLVNCSIASRRESLMLFDLWKMSFSFESESCAYVVRAMWQMLWSTPSVRASWVESRQKYRAHERPAIGIVIPRTQSGIIVHKRQNAIFFFFFFRKENACILRVNLFNLLSAWISFHTQEHTSLRVNHRWIIYYLQMNQQRIYKTIHSSRLWISFFESRIIFNNFQFIFSLSSEF